MTEGKKDADLEKGEFYLFVSLDLVGSTEFKSTCSLKGSYGWVEIIKHFFEFSKRSFATPKILSIESIKVEGFEDSPPLTIVTSNASSVFDQHRREFFLWKTLGDEVVVYLPISDTRDLRSGFYSAHTTMIEVQNTIDKNTGGELSVKGAAWIAKVFERESSSRRNAKLFLKNHEGIFFQKNKWAASFEQKFFNTIEKLLSRNKDLISRLKELDPNFVAPDEVVHDKERLHVTKEIKKSLDELEPDFVGLDIDIGFRGAGYSWSKKLQVSLDLAYMLSSCDDRYLKFLKILKRKRLKGVWSERAYPIIWFDPIWAEEDWDLDVYKEELLNGEDIPKNEIIEDIIDGNIDLKKETLLEDFEAILKEANQLERLKSYLEELSEEGDQEAT